MTTETTPADKQTDHAPTQSGIGITATPPVGTTDATGLKIRMYRVGFGDFFLVTIPTSSGNQFILIDCGVFKGTSGTGDLGSIVDAVEDMHRTTDGHLALVIMTHRHADHIAGFSKAPQFEKFEASMVWMPYWEQFNDPKDKAKKGKAKKEKAKKDNDTDKDEEDDDKKFDNSAHNLLVDIDELAKNLAFQFRGKEDPDAKEALAQLANATGIEDFSVAPKRGGGNAAALDMLKNHLGKNGENVRYYAAGDEPELPAELKGLKAKILGPPPQKAKVFLTLMDLKKGVGQYLDSMSDGDHGEPETIKPFPKEWYADFEEDHPKDYPKLDLKDELIDYKQFAQDVEKAQPDMLAAAAGKIENFLNNQSLVVLFEFGGKRLLFAGDAQGGNWEYWLFKTDEPQKDPTKAGDLTETSRELLETIDFYKVGHHGSTNATPIQAIEAAVARPVTSPGFISMCSTEEGVYGNSERGTEVPRTPLIEVLKKGSCLVRSDAVEVRRSDGTVVKANEKAEPPKPKVGKIEKTNLYIEYSF